MEGFCSTIELHPLRLHDRAFTIPALHCCSQLAFWWRRLDSNQRRRKPTDLQSAPFSHSGTPPQRTGDYDGNGAQSQGLRRYQANQRSHLMGAERGRALKAKTPGLHVANRGFSMEEPDDYLLSHGQSALSSAWSRFTVLFGMGRGGTDSLWSSGMTCCCAAWAAQPIWEEVGV